MLCVNNWKYTVIRRAAYYWHNIGTALKEENNYVQVLQSSLYVLWYIKLPLDKIVRGMEERIPAQVTEGLVNWNLVPLILSKNVHPMQAELSDGAGAPGCKHILQL